MAVRQIKHNDRSVTGSLKSGKMESIVDFESSLERDFFTWCEFNPTVEEYLHQPLSIEYRCSRGIQRTYTPDVLVIFSDSREPILVEVKYKDDFKEQFRENKEKFRAAIKYCVRMGWKFEVIDESIRTDYLKNAKFLMNFNFEDLIEEERSKMINHMKLMKSFTPREFIQSFAKTEYVQGVYLRFFWILVRQRIVLCDLRKPLTMSTNCVLSNEYETYY